MKKHILALTAIAALATLGACNKTEQAANVEAMTENVADKMEDTADNMTNETASDMMDNKADAVRSGGENKAAAIDSAASNGASNATLNAMAK